ncbi:MAG: tRNA (guanosine(46)-N7)-methyltransferase TrmB [Puniceicoccaceae bacterium]
MTDPFPRTDKHADYLKRRGDRIVSLNGQIREAFPGNQPVTLEVGCGHGHYLTAYAEQHPEANCLGIDIVSKRIRKACEKRDKRHLENLHFLKAEVQECLQAWPAEVPVERIFILFPDPWPKKRHTKNRIIQADLLDRLARLGTPGAVLHFRTDHRANFDWCSEVIADHPLWLVQADAPWPFENPSFFQNLFAEYYSLTALLADIEAG